MCSLMHELKLLNNKNEAVLESLKGFCLLHPSIKLLEETKVLYREDIRAIRNEQVTLISGGGAGHEPSHIGYIGKGMLSAAVCGDVFSSPSTSQVYSAVQLASGNKGVLMIVKNYTGDKINFGRALEKARGCLSIPIDMVIVDDDCSIDSTRAAGRRGLAATVFVHKIAGYAASQGWPLEQVTALAQKAIRHTGTVGVGILFNTDKERREMELGLGIHGEPGYSRKPLEQSQAVIRSCFEKIENHPKKVGWDTHPSVALLVNNLGGTSELEMGIVARDSVVYCQNRGVTISRMFCGSYMTSLDMPGMSISILCMADDVFLEALDYPTEAPNWKRSTTDIHRTLSSNNHPSTITAIERNETLNWKDSLDEKLTPLEVQFWKSSILGACQGILLKENEITDMDMKVGDGDCGITLSKGAAAIQNAIQSQVLEISTHTSPGEILSQLSSIIDHNMGGSSGGFYCVMLESAANYFFKSGSRQNHRSETFIEAFTLGIQAIMKYGGATLGDRTMLDTYIPILRDLKGTPITSETMKSIGKLAMQYANETSKMGSANAGRSSYLSDGQALGIADPGAFAAGIMIQRISEALVELM